MLRTYVTDNIMLAILSSKANMTGTSFDLLPPT